MCRVEADGTIEAWNLLTPIIIDEVYSVADKLYNMLKLLHILIGLEFAILISEH